VVVAVLCRSTVASTLADYKINTNGSWSVCLCEFFLGICKQETILNPQLRK
jgi:hypothetical protein